MDQIESLGAGEPVVVNVVDTSSQDAVGREGDTEGAPRGRGGGMEVRKRGSGFAYEGDHPRFGGVIGEGSEDVESVRDRANGDSEGFDRSMEFLEEDDIGGVGESASRGFSQQQMLPAT